MDLCNSEQRINNNVSVGNGFIIHVFMSKIRNFPYDVIFSCPFSSLSTKESDRISSFINMRSKSYSIRSGGESPGGCSNQQVKQSIPSFKLRTNLIIFQRRQVGCGGSRKHGGDGEAGLGGVMVGGEGEEVRWWEGDWREIKLGGLVVEGGRMVGGKSYNIEGREQVHHSTFADYTDFKCEIFAFKRDI